MIPNNQLFFENINPQQKLNNYPRRQKKDNYIRRKHYVMINSKDRDTDIYIQPESYTIDLPTTFKNIESVRLVSGTIPDVANVRDEPFLFLDIKEFNDTYSKFYTSSGNINIFDIIRFSDNVTSTKFIYLQPGLNNFYKPVLAKLRRLTIRIRDQNGNLFSFGDDSTFNILRQHTFVLELTELVHNVYQIEEEIVY